MLDAMGQELAGPESSPLEHLVAERIVMCWLHLYYAEAVYIQSMQELTLRQSEFHQKRITLVRLSQNSRLYMFNGANRLRCFQ